MQYLVNEYKSFLDCRHHDAPFAAFLLAKSIHFGNCDVAYLIIHSFSLDVNAKVPVEKFENHPDYTNTNIVYQLPLQIALHSADVCKMLLECPNIHVRIKTHRGTPLQHACHFQDGDVMKELLKHPDIDTSGIWPIMFQESGKWDACIEVAELLLAHHSASRGLSQRISMSSGDSGHTCLFQRLLTVSSELIMLLVRRPELDMTDIDSDGKSFLHRVLWRPPFRSASGPDLLRAVLERTEADVHHKDNSGLNAIDIVLHRIEYARDNYGVDTLLALKTILLEHGAVPTEVPFVTLELAGGKVVELKAADFS